MNQQSSTFFLPPFLAAAALPSGFHSPLEQVALRARDPVSITESNPRWARFNTSRNDRAERSTGRINPVHFDRFWLAPFSVWIRGHFASLFDARFR
jgi:hypothetical protein